MSRQELWQPRDPFSRLLLDLASDRFPEVHPRQRIDIALVARHGLLAIMAYSGNPSLSQPVKLLHARLVARQGVIEYQLGRILAKLDEAEVPAAVLKGPALAARYRDRRLRTFTDVDLLVPADRLEPALSVFQADEALIFVPNRRPRAAKRELLMIDTSSGMQFTVDLHWDPFSYSQLRGRAASANEDVWRRANKVTDDIGPRWLLPPEAEIAFLCAHAILDHRFRLILFRDLMELARTPIEWSSLLDFSHRHGLRSVVYLAWLIANRAVGASVPLDVLGALRPRGWALDAAEHLLSRTNLVTFDGHRSHPLNLALVLVHDNPFDRIRLAVRAPLVLPSWRRRVKQRALSNQLAPWERPSITILVASTKRRGAEVFGEQLTAGLKRLGWRAELVALTGGGLGPQVEANVLFETRPSGRLDRSLVLALRRHLRTTQPRVVLAFGSSTLKYSVAAVRLLLDRPALAYASIGEPLYWAKTARQRILYSALLRMVDLVLSVSRRTAVQLEEGLKVSAGKIRVVPTGIPDEFLRLPRHADPTVLKVLFMGSLSPEKNPFAALDAFAQAAVSIPAKMILLGSGSLAAELQERIDQGSLQHLVELKGSVEDVRPHLAWADVLVLTSSTEGLPAAVLEASAAGVAVVAYDVGGVGEVVIDGVTGRLITPGDVGEIAASLTSYWRHPEDLVRAGHEGRKLIAADFTLEAAVRRYARVLETLVSGQKYARESIASRRS